MKKGLSIVFALAALLFVGLAIYYWMTPAGSLPHHFPGYEAHSTHKHLKHGLAALILAVGCAVLAWFSLGKKGSGSSSADITGTPTM